MGSSSVCLSVCLSVCVCVCVRVGGGRGGRGWQKDFCATFSTWAIFLKNNVSRFPMHSFYILRVRITFYFRLVRSCKSFFYAISPHDEMDAP